MPFARFVSVLTLACVPDEGAPAPDYLTVLRMAQKLAGVFSFRGDFVLAACEVSSKLGSEA
jgi:hypothetical protein